jgi:hypothetical protein
MSMYHDRKVTVRLTVEEYIQARELAETMKVGWVKGLTISQLFRHLVRKAHEEAKAKDKATTSDNRRAAIRK